MEPRVLIGGMIEVAAVGRRKRRKLGRTVMGGRIIDLQAVVGDEQAVVDTEGQLSHRQGGSALCEVVEAKAREAQVGFSAKHDVEVGCVALRKHGGHGTAGDQQAVRQACFDHLGDGERVVGQADHRGDPDNVGPVRAQVVAQLLEGAECTVEHPGLDPEPAQLAGQRGHPERREEQLGRRSRSEIGKDQRYPGHTVPQCQRPPV